MVIEKMIAAILMVLLFPVFILVSITIWLNDFGNPFFCQRRMGKNRKIFTMYKFRTMIEGAEKLANSLKNLNEADGPVFKIRNDPRFTVPGKFFAKTGLDELPQLINIIKGEMSFFGPRPLPVKEARKVPQKYWRRFSILPGLISSWWVKGNHKLSFKQWMEEDLDDVQNLSIKRKIVLSVKTMILSVGLFIKYIFSSPEKTVLICIFLAGLYMRVVNMGRYAMWADEAFYLTGTWDFSIKDVIMSRHPFVDNPPGYFLFLRVWSKVSTDLIWLRLPGIILYGASFLFLQKSIKTFSFASKLSVALSYSLLPYFVNMNFWISPYNFVFFFQILLIYLTVGFIEKNVGAKRFLPLFVLINFLMINTHYSSIYFLASYIPLLFVLFVHKNEKIKTLLLGVSTVALLSIPNILMVIYNIVRIVEINDQGMVLPLTSVYDFASFIVGKSFLLSDNRGFAVVLLLSLFVTSFFMQRVYKKTYIYVFALTPVISTILLITVGYSSFSSILVERNFYSLFLGMYLLMALSLYRIKKIPAKIGIALVAIILLTQIVGSKETPRPMPGDVKDRYVLQKRMDMYSDLILDNAKGKNIVLFGKIETNHYFLKYIYMSYYLRKVYQVDPSITIVGIADEKDLREYLVWSSPVQVLVLNFNSDNLSPDLYNDHDVINFGEYLLP